MSDLPKPHEIKPLPYKRNQRHWLNWDWKYTLTEDIRETFNTVYAGGEFENKWLRIRSLPLSHSTEIIVRKDYSDDGCTFVTDLGGRKTVMGAHRHDPIYQFAKAIAAAWGWSIPAVLRFGDKVFLESMRREGSHFARPFFFGVRAFGTPFWYLMHWREWSLFGKPKARI